jgi:hypothetical protein
MDHFFRFQRFDTCKDTIGHTMTEIVNNGNKKLYILGGARGTNEEKAKSIVPMELDIFDLSIHHLTLTIRNRRVFSCESKGRCSIQSVFPFGYDAGSAHLRFWWI